MRCGADHLCHHGRGGPGSASTAEPGRLLTVGEPPDQGAGAAAGTGLSVRRCAVVTASDRSVPYRSERCCERRCRTGRRRSRGRRGRPPTVMTETVEQPSERPRVRPSGVEISPSSEVCQTHWFHPTQTRTMISELSWKVPCLVPYSY